MFFRCYKSCDRVESQILHFSNRNKLETNYSIFFFFSKYLRNPLLVLNYFIWGNKLLLVSIYLTVTTCLINGQAATKHRATSSFFSLFRFPAVLSFLTYCNKLRLRSDFFLVQQNPFAVVDVYWHSLEKHFLLDFFYDRRFILLH